MNKEKKGTPISEQKMGKNSGYQTKKPPHGKEFWIPN